MRLRRKPLVHEAHIFDGTERSVNEARFLLENRRGDSKIVFTKPHDGSPGHVTVASINGPHSWTAKNGDYLVKDKDGEILVLAPETIAANFDILEDK
jgi:hypothetical protein